MDLRWALWVLGSYLAGSIPFGLLIGLARGVDIRKVGSGNVGATNVTRTLGKPWGIACFVLDVLKGLVPVLAAGFALGYARRSDLSTTDQWKWLAVGAASVVGHVFPVWLRFRGGKGVATSLGVLMGFWPTLTIPGIGAGIVWVACAAVWRYVSLASIAAAVSLPVLLVVVALAMGRDLTGLVPFLVVSTLLALLVVLRHRSNIARLRAGTENKMGRKHAPPS